MLKGSIEIGFIELLYISFVCVMYSRLAEIKNIHLFMSSKNLRLNNFASANFPKRINDMYRRCHI